MSTHQVSYPCFAKYSIAELSGRPGTSRSKVGCDAIEEPCTNRMVPFVAAGLPATLFQRKSLTSPFLVQCSVPGRRTCTFIAYRPNYRFVQLMPMLFALMSLPQRSISDSM